MQNTHEMIEKHRDSLEVIAGLKAMDDESIRQITEMVAERNNKDLQAWFDCCMMIAKNRG